MKKLHLSEDVVVVLKVMLVQGLVIEDTRCSVTLRNQSFGFIHRFPL